MLRSALNALARGDDELADEVIGFDDEVDLRYVGRPWRASTSEGYPTAHSLEQDRIAREALGAF
jgi:2-oxoglutarate dehydrogenase complex dehydrogenase (E1) component-like enzyme